MMFDNAYDNSEVNLFLLIIRAFLGHFCITDSLTHKRKVVLTELHVAAKTSNLKLDPREINNNKYKVTKDPRKIRKN